MGALKALLLPPVVLVLVIGFALVFARTSRACRIVAGVATCALFAMCLPIVEIAFLRLLDPPSAFAAGDARAAQALVVLGGGVRANAPDYGGDTLGRLTLERVRFGAKIARETNLPVLLSGGSPLNTRSEAELMREAFESEYGIRARWVEADSRNTRENAENSSHILRAQAISTVVLVTHAFHAKRAGEEFARVGIQVIPAVTGLPDFDRRTWRDWIPSARALEGTHYAFHELAGLLAMRARSLVDAQPASTPQPRS